jgi:hypothetical protein
MSAEAITIISGIALLVVFALVGWNLRRNSTRDEPDGRNETKP